MPEDNWHNDAVPVKIVLSNVSRERGEVLSQEWNAIRQRCTPFNVLGARCVTAFSVCLVSLWPLDGGSVVEPQFDVTQPRTVPVTRDKMVVRWRRPFLRCNWIEQETKFSGAFWRAASCCGGVKCTKKGNQWNLSLSYFEAAFFLCKILEQCPASNESAVGLRFRLEA